MREHRVIERVVAFLGAEAEAIPSRGAVDPRVIDLVTDFIRTYADRCHHGKEEDILFARLAEKDLDEGIAAEMRELVAEHVHAREMTGRLVAANEAFASGDTTALDRIQSAMRELAAFYPAHIAKEDKHFFKPCMAYFAEDDQSAMLEDFDRFDQGLVHEKYRGVAATLEGRVR
jgi:hemerythrin-like domain-containing protein